MLSTILLIAAVIVFILAAIPVPVGRVNLLPVGLACVAGAMLASRMAL